MGDIILNLANALETLYGTRPSELTRLPFSSVNEVFLALIGSRALVIKVPRHRLDWEGHALQLNKRCAEILRPLGVPTPKTITIQVGDVSHPTYSVEEHFPGINAGTLGWRPLIRCYHAYLPQLAKIAETIHSITVGGFGPLDRGHIDTWQAFLTLPVLGVHECAERIVTSRLMTADQLMTAAALLVSLSAGVAVEGARLLHGDLAPNNILLSGATISGIVDWGDALGGDPLYDLVQFEFYCGHKPFAALLFEYQRYSRSLQHPDPRLLDCYRLSIAMSKFSWRTATDRTDLLVRPAKLIRDIIGRY